MTPGDTSISIRGLTFAYEHGAVPALRDVTLDVARGEYVGIVGLNGSGKTTLALCLDGIVPQVLRGTWAGSVVVEGRDTALTPVRELARLVAMVFDAPELQLSQATAADEIALGLEHQGVPPDEMPGRIAEALDAVGLRGVDDRSPFELSGGEQQRLAIACALAVRPRVLVMDEPLGNLDPAGRLAVRGIVRRLNREAGVTVVMAEHDVEALAEDAGRIVVLDHGAVVADGAAAVVLGDLVTLRAAGLRAPQVTELAGSLDARRGPLPVTVDAAIAWLAANG